MRPLTKKFTRWFLPSLLAILAIFAFITPCLAINPPDSLSIDGIWAYRNYRLTGDQLYIIKYTITYSTTPSTSATNAYVVRLMDGVTDLASTSPYAYHDNGYGEGVVALYFDPGSAPAWEGNYTVILMGSPFAAWNGTIPYVSTAAFTSWQDNPLTTTPSLVSLRVLVLAQELEDAWNVDMVETTGSGSTLTLDGQAYFLNVVPYLMDAAPYTFPTSIVQPIYPNITRDDTYATDLQDMSEGTILDISPAATLFGLSRGDGTAVIYYGAVILFLIVVCIAMNTYKPLMLLLAPFVALGWVVGAPLAITVYAGIIAMFLLLFEVLYHPAPG